MSWLDLCDNPGAISTYYTSPPSLEWFEVVDVTLMHYSPSLHLTGIVPVQPDKDLARGQAQQPAAVNLTLAFFGLSDLFVEGPPQDAVGSLSLASCGDNRVAFDFRSGRMTCRGAARHAMVEGISPRTSAEKPTRGPRLFSYPNVWNSCLLLARSKGFSLRLVGYPDEQGSISGCRWRATKEDGTELTGDNPIELAGLIALYEHHRPEQNREYWWRIQGPDVMTELWEKWAVFFFGPKGHGSPWPDHPGDADGGAP